MIPELDHFALALGCALAQAITSASNCLPARPGAAAISRASRRCAPYNGQAMPA